MSCGLFNRLKSSLFPTMNGSGQLGFRIGCVHGSRRGRNAACNPVPLTLPAASNLNVPNTLFGDIKRQANASFSNETKSIRL